MPGISLELIDDTKTEKTFNNYVQDVHNAEVINVVQRFVDRQKKKLNSKELLSNVTMIQRHNKLDHTITGDSRFVGYAITPRESKSINVNIKSIGLQSSASESCCRYLYFTTKPAGIGSNKVSFSGK